jgi:hypothetical protein
MMRLRQERDWPNGYHQRITGTRMLVGGNEVRDCRGECSGGAARLRNAENR